MTLTPSEILNHLTGLTPISIIRCGDGESIVLRSTESLQAQRLCLDAVMKRQMGYEPIVTQLTEIRNNLIEAYSKADIIGVPMQKNLDDLSKHWREVEETLNTYIPQRTVLTCSTDIGYDMLSADMFTQAFIGLDVLNYIGCRQLEEPMRKAWTIKQVNGYHIAPEAKFTFGYDGDIHYPTQFNRCQRWMDVVKAEGRILLVGAGVIGKIYCNWWPAPLPTSPMRCTA